MVNPRSSVVMLLPVYGRRGDCGVRVGSGCVNVIAKMVAVIWAHPLLEMMRSLTRMNGNGKMGELCLRFRRHFLTGPKS